MKKSFLSVFSIFLLSLALAGMSSAIASEKKKTRVPGASQNLDVGAPAPQRGLGSELRYHSYIIPYIPEDLVMDWDSPEAGPCTADGTVVRGATSSRKCNIYHSREANAVFKVMNLKTSGHQSIPMIFRRDKGQHSAWEIWVECSGAQCTPVSRRAQEYAASKGLPGRRSDDQPQYARENQAVPDIPAAPSLGTILDLIKKSR